MQNNGKGRKEEEQSGVSLVLSWNHPGSHCDSEPREVGLEEYDIDSCQAGLI